MADHDPKLIALRFNAAINKRNLDALAALMTEDHVFIDTDNKINGG